MKKKKELRRPRNRMESETKKLAILDMRFGCTGEVKRFLQKECGDYQRSNGLGNDTYFFETGERVSLKGVVSCKTVEFVGSRYSPVLEGLRREVSRGAGAFSGRLAA